MVPAKMASPRGMPTMFSLLICIARGNRRPLIHGKNLDRASSATQ